MSRTKVFISYSHNDIAWLERLQVHLKPLERDGFIERWDDTCIKPGEKWLAEIEKALDRAQVAVLLVSADFLASDFIANNELPPLLESAEREGTVILSIILSPCLIEQSPLVQFEAVNFPNQPLISMDRGAQEQVFVKVAESIQAALRVCDETKITDSQPKFKDEQIRVLSEELKSAYQQKDELLRTGQDTMAVQKRILKLRSQMREGP